MKAIRAWFTKGLLVSMVWAIMVLGVAPVQADGQSFVPVVAVSSSPSPASVAGPVTFTPAALSPSALPGAVEDCWRCYCFTGEPPHWSECQGEYGYDCMCEGCFMPQVESCREYVGGGIEACEGTIVGQCGGSFLAGGGSDCGCDCDLENNTYALCDSGGGGSAALLDGTRLYGVSSLPASGPNLSEGRSTTITLHRGLTWQAVPGLGDVVRSRCDDTVVARVYTPERAASVRDALSVLSL